MTREEEIRARLGKLATPGPWYFRQNNGSLILDKDGIIVDEPLHAMDAVFIANAPSDVSYLLNRVSELQGDIARHSEFTPVLAKENKRLINEVTKYRELARWIKAEAPTKYSRIADLIINQKSACTCAISNVASLHCPIHGLDQQSSQGYVDA